MKKKLTKILAVVLVVTMIAGISAYAAGGKVEHTRHVGTYVCIGDSIAAGYGMNGDSDPLGTYGLLNRFAVGHGELVDGTYPKLVSEGLTADKTYNLSRSAFMTVDWLRLLDPEFEEELSQPENYLDRFCSECDMFFTGITDIGDLLSLSETAIEAVKEADVITLNVGSNDIATYALLINIYKAMYLTYGMSAEAALTAIEGKMSSGATIEDLIEMVSLDGGFKLITEDMETGYENFKKYWTRLVERIHELNPDAEIYQVGVYNIFDTVTLTQFSTEPELKDWGWEQCEKTNNFTRYESESSKYLTGFVDVRGTETWDIPPMTDPSFLINFLIIVHPDAAGHEFIANQILDAINLKGSVTSPYSESGSDNETPTTTTGFTDVDSNAWYSSFVQYAVENGFMSGTSSTTFEPYSCLTRAMVVTMLYAMEGKPSTHSVSSFSDVGESDYYSAPVTWAESAGVVSGFNDGTFRPNTNVTREQLATMLRAYAEYKGKDTSASGDLSAYVDGDGVSPYAMTPVSWAVDHGIIAGDTDSRINPQGETTRAEAAAMFTTFSKNILS